MAPRNKKTLFGAALDGTFGRFLRRMPKQSRSRSLVTAIVQALDEQIAAGTDFDEVTIEHLSERAGVGVGSFYEYFSGKDSLLGALVGRVTDRNFVVLAERLDAHPTDDPEELVRLMAEDVAHAYLAHPKRMRLVVEAIGRLRLLGVVNAERDRFAEVMTSRARRLMPDEDPARLGRTMQIIADASMGVLVAAADRDPPGEPDVVAEEITALGVGVLRRRHPKG